MSKQNIVIYLQIIIELMFFFRFWIERDVDVERERYVEIERESWEWGVWVGLIF